MLICMPKSNGRHQRSLAVSRTLPFGWRALCRQKRRSYRACRYTLGLSAEQGAAVEPKAESYFLCCRQLEVEQQTRTAAREVDSLHAGFHTKLSNIRQQHESDMAASKAALSESQQASLGLSQEKGMPVQT